MVVIFLSVTVKAMTENGRPFGGCHGSCRAVDEHRQCRGDSCRGHTTVPYTSGSRRSRACSSSVISFSRFTPSFMFWILSCSLSIESSSISGRGGQPGR
jgi:hypothetical protein